MEAFWEQFQHLKHFSLEEIKSITGDFDAKNLIGEGGFGKVYEGVLSDSEGQIKVAFKRLSSNSLQGKPAFMKEIIMLSSYKHDNLISLVGVCNEDREMILAYEHASRGSLDRYLGDRTLAWTQRLKICLGAAKGLAYLHDPNGTQQRVIHRDIKCSNILLDENWNAKVSDMGLSKIGPANQLLHSFLATNVAGTPSYVDPAYLETGILTKESDVYSFGVVLFEVMCGRLCLVKESNHFQSLVRWWKESYNEKKVDEIIFHSLKPDMDMRSRKIFSEIAYQCLLESRAERPHMSHVVEKLEILFKIEAEKQEKIEAERQEKMRIEEEKQKKIEAERQEKMRIEAEKQKKIEAEKEEKMRIEAEKQMKFEAKRQKKIEAEELEIALKIQKEIFEIALECQQDIPKMEEFKEIVKSVVNRKELKMLLSTGVLINGRKKWFSLNENGEHCMMISRKCFSNSHGFNYNDDPSHRDYVPYHGENKTRFELRNRKLLFFEFDAHMKTQFLSPNTAYRVNLVFMFRCERAAYWGFSYRSVSDHTAYLRSYEAHKREDGWLTAELYEFINGTSNVDIQLKFESLDGIDVEGIEFVPLEKLEDEDGAGDGDGDDTYREQKLPNDYEDMIKWSKDRLQWTTMKELYSIFRKGFLMNSGEEWFSLTKSGKICHMRSAKLALKDKPLPDEPLPGDEPLLDDDEPLLWKWQSLSESRFLEVAFHDDANRDWFFLHLESNILSPQTRYGAYLVYKLQEPNGWFEHRFRCSQPYDPHNSHCGRGRAKIYLIGADEAPVIPGKLYPRKRLPQQRNDVWMEVQLYKFQTNTERISIDVFLCLERFKPGVIFQGIEFRRV